MPKYFIENQFLLWDLMWENLVSGGPSVKNQWAPYVFGIYFLFPKKEDKLIQFESIEFNNYCNEKENIW